MAKKRCQISSLSRKFEFTALYSNQLIQIFWSGARFATFFWQWDKSVKIPSEINPLIHLYHSIYTTVKLVNLNHWAFTALKPRPFKCLPALRRTNRRTLVQWKFQTSTLLSANFTTVRRKAKVALRFGCSKQSKNLEWYLRKYLLF
jgi:hypothetical protein